MALDERLAITRPSLRKRVESQNLLGAPGPGSSGAGRPGPRAPLERARGAWSRMKKSVWAPIAAKGLGVSVLLIALAAIGGVAESREAPGHTVEAAPAPAAHKQAGSPWLATQAGAAGPSGHPASSKSASPSSEPSASPPPSPGITPDGKVILNLASITELTRLPGIGQKRAEAIVKLRERLGKFKRITDLLRVKGIGPKSLKKLKPHLVLDPPKPPVEPDPPKSGLSRVLESSSWA